MEKARILIRRAVVASCAALLLLGSAVYAMTLQEAKAAGLLGERADGYIGVVRATPEVNQIASDINSKRRAEYQSIANRNGTSLEAVEALAGETAIGKTPGGQYIYTNDGWRKK